jgi:HEAT repeat protein
MLFEEELQVGLMSSEPSLRLASIESAIRNGKSREVIDVLSAHQKREANEDCRVLLQHAIDAITRRLSPRPAGIEELSGDVSLQEFVKVFQKAEPTEKLRRLQEIKGRKLAEFAAFAPTMLAEEKHPSAAAAIIRAFGMHWPRGDLRNLLLKLGSNHLSLRLAALEVLVKRIPQELSASLPRLLISTDPRIRGLAIRGLAAIDLSEALEHNEYLLAGDSINEKLVGIENSFFFPFERVKSLLLRALARENDPGILAKIGSLFAINPDIEAPYRLWEMVDISSPEKSAIIKGIIKDACNALEKSGRLSGEDFQKYRENLSAWAQQRYATKFVQDCISQLSAAAHSEIEFEAAISKNLELPYVHSAFLEALKWPLKTEVRALIERMVNRPPPETRPERAIESDSDHSGEDLPREIRRVAMLQNLDRKQARQEIEKILSDESGRPALLATAFRTAGRLELADFTDAASRFLEGSDPVVTSAVIEYLNQFGYDRLLPYLEEFIRSDDLKIKVAALRALKKKNPADALRILRTMLSSPDAGRQSSALAGMVHMDFPLIRETLGAYLSGNPASDLFNDALCLFSANPDPQNLHVLNRTLRTLTGDSAQQVQTIIRQTEELLLDNGQITPIELEEKNERIREDLEAEEKKEQSEPAPYALHVLVPESRPTDLWHGKPTKREDPEERKLTISLVGASILLLVVLALVQYFGGASTFSVGLRQPREVKGMILESYQPNHGLILQTEDGKKLRIQTDPGDSRLSSLPRGGNFKGFLVPAGNASDGILIFRFHSWDNK